MFVEARKTEVVLAIPNKKSSLNKKGVPLEQIWELQSQLPGSGTLDVECFHRGPTLVPLLFVVFFSFFEFLILNLCNFMLSDKAP